ncbi:MAG: CDP-alcohol phosphatidyltransferase family protein [Rhizobiaceae bacterium]
MLDGWARRQIDPLVEPVATAIAGAGLSANAITVLSCLVGLAGTAAVATGWFLAGLALILTSRFGDALDGAVARINGKTDFGGYLDIVLDFVFYGAVPMGFVLADPVANAVAGSALVLSFYINGSSFLAYAIMADRRGLDTAARGSKSLYFTTGLAEATETIAAFVLACLFPPWFPIIATIFAAMTLYTALARIVLAARTLR